jgi:hypothetical protein
MLQRSLRKMSKVFELRTYDVHPQHVPAYVKATKENFHLRTAHSVLNGFWVTEIGGQNQMVHIWEYESLTQRKAVRDALAADASWIGGYVDTIRPHLQKQDNVFMTGAADALPAGEGPFFYWLAQGAVDVDAKHANVARCGAWSKALAGANLGETVALWRSNKLEDLLAFSQAAGECCKVDGKLLYPAAFVNHVVRDWK